MLENISWEWPGYGANSTLLHTLDIMQCIYKPVLN